MQTTNCYSSFSENFLLTISISAEDCDLRPVIRVHWVLFSVMYVPHWFAFLMKALLVKQLMCNTTLEADVT